VKKKIIKENNDSVLEAVNPESDYKFKKEQYPPLEVKVLKPTEPKIPTQQERVMAKLQSDVDDSLRDEVKRICLSDKFIIDGYNLEWNKISKNVIKNIGELIDLEKLPEDIKKKTENEKGDWLQVKYLQLMYKGFTDDMYWNMSIPALKVLDQAPGVRIDGLFRQSET
jgi:hypothetical protein